MQDLQKDLNYNFKNIDLLKTALTHSSCKQNDPNIEDNQRLEFLGDAVLEFVVSNIIFNKFKDQDEGALTKLRAKLVCRSTLVSIAKNINLGRYLIMTKSMESMDGRNNQHNLEDAMEAMIAAIYLDSDIATVTNIVKNLIEQLPNPYAYEIENNKGALQEYLQSKKIDPPTYKLISSYGPPHDCTFKIGLYLNNRLVCVGIDSNKKSAEQNAAKQALEIFREKFNEAY